MPRSIVLEDGSQIEVPTDEELSSLKSKAEQADTLSKQITDLQAEKERLLSDPVEKNFRAMREINQKLTEALKKQGKQVSDDGTVSDQPKMLTVEEIEAKARQAAQAELLSARKQDLLLSIDPEKRQTVEHFFNKLTQGEQLTSDNMSEFMRQAHLLADPQAATSKAQRTPHVNGQPPRFAPPESNNFADSDVGKSIANELFGGLSYGTKK